MEIEGTAYEKILKIKLIECQYKLKEEQKPQGWWKVQNKKKREKLKVTKRNTSHTYMRSQSKLKLS